MALSVLIGLEPSPLGRIVTLDMANWRFGGFGFEDATEAPGFGFVTAACKDLKLKHIRTKPYTPKTNGKAERFIQTALREWAYARACQTSEQRKIHLPEWTHMYKWHRPHGSLNSKPPISRIAHAMNNLLRSGVWHIAQGTPNKSEDFQMATPRPNAPLFRARVRPGDCGIRFGRRLAAAQGRPLLQDMSHRGRS